MSEERLPWNLLGREIGTATGWDQADTFIVQLYDFVPASGVDLPEGTLTIDFESGDAMTHDDEGNVTASKDLVSALAAVTRHQGQDPQ